MRTAQVILMGAAFGGLTAAAAVLVGGAVLMGIGLGLTIKNDGWAGLVYFAAGLAGAYAGNKIGASWAQRIQAGSAARAARAGTGGGSENTGLGQGDINEAIDQIGKNQDELPYKLGGKVTSKLQELNAKGKIGFQELDNIPDGGPDVKGIYQNGRISIDYSVDKNHLPGFLAHEGTHGVLNDLGLGGRRFNFIQEIISFQSQSAIDNALNTFSEALSPELIRKQYEY